MSRAVDGWRGPMGTDQDFQLGPTCVEVKTSTAANLDRLNISGERQLEVPDDVTTDPTRTVPGWQDGAR